MPLMPLYPLGPRDTGRVGTTSSGGVCVRGRGRKRLGLRGAKVGEVVKIFKNKTSLF